MSVEDTVRFAQDNFGTSEGLPNGHERSPVPDWLVGRAENALPIDAHDDIEVESDDVEGGTFSEDDDYPENPGIDSLAYYLPFHFYKSDWGIYIRALGIERLARELASPKHPVGITAIRSAYHILLEHERVHFFCELAASRIEVITDDATYRPYFQDKSAGEHEEAIANAAALMKSGTRDSQLRSARIFMERQGPGYRDFDNWTDANFPMGERRAVSNMISTKKGLSRPGEFLFDISKFRPPMFLVFDMPVPWLRLVKSFPKLELQVFVHTNDHKPPHIHVDFLDGSNPRKNRFEWDSLRPLKGTPSRPKRDLESLEAYVEQYRDQIADKIKKVPWN